MQHNSLNCWLRTSWWCYSLSAVLCSCQGCLSSMDVTLLKALFPSLWHAFNKNQNKTDYWSSKGRRRSFCGWSKLMVVATSMVLTGILTYGEGRGGMFFLVRKNSDHWRELVPAISPVGNAGKKAFVKEVGRILKDVLGALLTSHVTSNFLAQICILKHFKCHFLTTCCSYPVGARFSPGESRKTRRELSPFM